MNQEAFFDDYEKLNDKDNEDLIRLYSWIEKNIKNREEFVSVKWKIIDIKNKLDHNERIHSLLGRIIRHLQIKGSDIDIFERNKTDSKYYIED